MPSSRQRLEVWRGNRLKTSGGLTKADLVKNKRGKIVSKKKSSIGTLSGLRSPKTQSPKIINTFPEGTVRTYIMSEI